MITNTHETEKSPLAKLVEDYLADEDKLSRVLTPQIQQVLAYDKFLRSNLPIFSNHNYYVNYITLGDDGQPAVEWVFDPQELPPVLTVDDFKASLEALGKSLVTQDWTLYSKAAASDKVSYRLAINPDVLTGTELKGMVISKLQQLKTGDRTPLPLDMTKDGRFKTRHIEALIEAASDEELRNSLLTFFGIAELKSISEGGYKHKLSKKGQRRVLENTTKFSELVGLFKFDEDVLIEFVNTYLANEDGLVYLDDYPDCRDVRALELFRPAISTDREVTLALTNLDKTDLSFKCGKLTLVMQDYRLLQLEGTKNYFDAAILAQRLLILHDFDVEFKIMGSMEGMDDEIAAINALAKDLMWYWDEMLDANIGLGLISHEQATSIDSAKKVKFLTDLAERRAFEEAITYHVLN